MAGITSTNHGLSVSSTLTSIGNDASALFAWINSALDQVTVRILPFLGKNSTGVVYAFTPITKPVFWELSPRRSTIFAIRTS